MRLENIDILLIYQVIYDMELDCYKKNIKKKFGYDILIIIKGLDL